MKTLVYLLSWFQTRESELLSSPGYEVIGQASLGWIDQHVINCWKLHVLGIIISYEENCLIYSSPVLILIILMSYKSEPT